MSRLPRRAGGLRRFFRARRRWWISLAAALGLATVAAAGFLAYLVVSYSRLVDARLHGERDRVLPRVFARPLELRRGQSLGARQVVDRLNDLGYAQRGVAAGPGEFTVDGATLVVIPRAGESANREVRVTVETPKAVAGQPARARIARLEVGNRSTEAVTFDPPLLTALVRTGRQKRRQVPLDAIPQHVQQAVLAIEDRRFYRHPGIDPVRMVGALVTNLRGDKPYLVGGSTLTQQLVKNFFLTPQKSLRRKLAEQLIALILETKTTKAEILELYLNEVYLGQRGSFAVHGVAEAARLYFGKDVANLSLAEAATLAGLIQSPFYWSPFTAPERALDRRTTVLHAMADEGFITVEAARRAGGEPLQVMQRALEAQAPYFVDVVGETLGQLYPNLSGTTKPLDVYTTLDLHLQRLAQDALREGLVTVDGLLAQKKRPHRAQAALIAVDPRTGEVLALVGGRSYNQSQYNRAVSARRQPGSVFKPFVYLAAFERGADEGRTDITPATVVVDEPTGFTFGDAVWEPRNYEDEYDGAVTLRRALALSRNVATIKVAELAGFDRVARLWRAIGVGADVHAYPSITLGVFEVSPWEIATAYTIFPTGGEARPLRVLSRVETDGTALSPPVAAAKRVARPETTFLVTNMMRSVINEGTGAGARAAGLAADVAGKTGTTNDYRDAWFAGFTAELLTVVWVGLDDNQPLGLSGTAAALPIWTAFMTRALAGHQGQSFVPPPDITYATIDRDTGKVAMPICPRVFQEAFLAGSEPTEPCDVHR